ncbi:LOW QUALITY PROTEIN: hypothetical protein BRADI_1g35835v3 [Brachypodium distachyon]|uniref:non-specific serine/threonine protein kinase n=1 Tax=Brachypodium distachyon TaxID=15368 RepID=A0A2K2DMX2_BRADI|nr:LOW QUALITY PROTEIN: hypothetical protein BRADI_1g35835v3 [Brachypodium distachyon]
MDARSQGKLISKRADTEFATGRFSMDVQTDGNVVLYVDLLSGNNRKNALLAHTDSPSGNTTLTFDDKGGLNYTLHNGAGQSLRLYKFARMDPDGIVRVYVRAAKSTSWSVSGAIPSNGCSKRTSGLQGACGPGSYCTEQKDRVSCVCPAGYTYTDAQHRDSSCTPEFVPQSCNGENNTGEYTLVDLPNTTWETSIYYRKYSSVTEDQCREYCLNDCFCAAALMIGGTDCVEMAAMTNGRQASDVTTKALIKVRRSNDPEKRDGENKNCTDSRGSLLSIRVHHLRKNRESQLQGLLSMRSFSWKELHQATNGFEKLLGKGSFGEVYEGRMKSPQQQLIAVKRLINWNESSEKGVRQRGAVHRADPPPEPGPHDRVYCKEGKHRMLVLEFMP